jgi:DHA1 family multidrug resistance protein-like MFS transporter
MTAAAAHARARWVLPLSMFIGTFAWSFVYVSLPFYIQGMSTLNPTATLRWTGWILGISPLITVITAPLSGRLAGRADPKRAYIAVQVFQGAGFFLMAVARSLLELFLARFLLGLMGAVSTFAFIMAGRSPGDVRRQVSAIQSGMTLGQVLGPAAGAVVAARLGFRLSFVLAGVLLWACSSLVGWGVPRGLTAEKADARPLRASFREVAEVCLLVLAGSTQVFFLTAILPQVLPALGIQPAATLEAGGLLIFVTGLAAALGSMMAPRVADLVGDGRVVPWLFTASSILLALLALPGDVWSFGLLRFLQVLCIAPLFPIAVAAIAQRASGEAVGFVNSSRIGAAFVGPVVATTLLAWMPPAAVYLALAGAGLGLVPVVARIDPRGTPREGSAP